LKLKSPWIPIGLPALLFLASLSGSAQAAGPFRQPPFEPVVTQAVPTHIHGDLNASLAALVEESALRNHVPVELVHRIIRVESRGQCGADSGVAKGVMQVKPATARSVGVYGNLKNCAVGVEAGVRYLKEALRLAHGNWRGAATLYNRGIYARPSNSQYAMNVLE
jgi:soluble lytic murein transglycosylase-like protein